MDGPRATAVPGAGGAAADGRVSTGTDEPACTATSRRQSATDATSGIRARISADVSADVPAAAARFAAAESTAAERVEEHAATAPTSTDGISRSERHDRRRPGPEPDDPDDAQAADRLGTGRVRLSSRRDS